MTYLSADNSIFTPLTHSSPVHPENEGDRCEKAGNPSNEGRCTLYSEGMVPVGKLD